MNFFSKNFHLKILAFLAGLGLWFFVVAVNNTIYTLPQEYDIKVQSLPSDLALSSPTGKARVRVRINQDDIKNFNKNDVEVTVDLKDLEAGDHSVPLLATLKNDKASVVKIEPDKINVRLVALTQKEVEIKTSVVGKPKGGFQLKEVILEQKKAKISGPKALLDTISTVTAEVRLDGTQSSNFKQVVKLELPKNKAEEKEIVLEPEQITAEVIILGEVKQKTVSIRADFQGAYPEGIERQLIISPKSVAIEGGEDELKKVTFLSTEPMDVNVLRSQTGPLKVKLKVPEGINLVNPQSITVNVSLPPVETNPDPFLVP